MTSEDGVFWQRRSIGLAAGLRAVAIQGSRLVVAGDQGAVALSEQ